MTDLLVDEGVARLAAGRDVLDERRCGGLAERVEEVVRIDTLEAGEQVEAKRLAGERGDSEDAAAIVADAASSTCKNDQTPVPLPMIGRRRLRTSSVVSPDAERLVPGP